MPDRPPLLTGADLRRYRLAKGWTLADLSEWTGLNRGHLSRLERGLSPMPPLLCRLLHRDGFRPRRER